jgi:hypothetical protein
MLIEDLRLQAIDFVTDRGSGPETIRHCIHVMRGHSEEEK